MTPRTDHDRLLICNETAALAQHYSTAPHTVSHLRASIDASIDDGLRGTSYDGIGGPGDGTSPTERAALGPHLPDCNRDRCFCPDKRSDQADLDLAQLDVALEHWEKGAQIMRRLDRRYSAASVIRAARPGVDPCPAGRCRSHWEASIDMPAAKKRYTDACRRCGDHIAKHGHAIPPLVLQAVQAAGGDWTSWRVKRAWTSTGAA